MASHFHGVEVSWPLSLPRKFTQKILRTRRCQDLEENLGRATKEYRSAEVLARGKPPRGKQGPRHRPRGVKGGHRVMQTAADAGTWRGSQK